MENNLIILGDTIQPAEALPSNKLLDILPIIRKYDRAAALAIWRILKKRGIAAELLKNL